MTVKINTIEDLNNHLKELPFAVIQDIDKRITAWIASGGTHDDNYIKQQFRYAENVINLRESK